MTPTTRRNIVKFDAAALAAATLPAQAVEAAAAPDLGSYAIARTLSGVTLLKVEGADGAGRVQTINLIQYTDGSGEITVQRGNGEGRPTRRLTVEQTAAFLAIFEDDEEGA